jgi:hypothetical protein
MTGAPSTDPREAQARKLVCNDLSVLAPKFGVKLRELLADANARGYDLATYETARSEELQQLYFAMGRTKAPTVWKSWHGFRLAADLISCERGWKVWPEWRWTDDARTQGEWASGDPDWYEPVFALIKAHGLRSGSEWKTFKDCPHVQWHCPGMLETPSAHAKELFDAGGYSAVWEAVQAA